MAVTKSKTMKPWVLVGGGVLAVSVVVWGVVGTGSADADGVSVPAEFTVDALATRSDDPGSAFRDLRRAMRGDELSDEQKRQVGKNMRAVRQAMMRARLDEYYNADAGDKMAILDGHIDEMQNRSKAFERRREDRENSGEGGMSEAERNKLRELFRPQSKQDRKNRSESRSPDDTARAMVYFTALQSRAQDRGVSLSRGPGGGGRGGAGGGPRGP